MTGGAPRGEVLAEVELAIEVVTVVTVVSTGALLGLSPETSLCALMQAALSTIVCVVAGAVLFCGRLAGVGPGDGVPPEHG